MVKRLPVDALSGPRSADPIGYDIAMDQARCIIGDINKNLKVAVKTVPRSVLIKFMQDTAIALETNQPLEGTLVCYYGPYGEKQFPDSRYPDDLFLPGEKPTRFFMHHPRRENGMVQIMAQDKTTVLVQRVDRDGKLSRHSPFWISVEHCL